MKVLLLVMTVFALFLLYQMMPIVCDYPGVSAKTRHTRQLIIELSTALNSYHQKFGEYPPSTVADPFLTCNPPVPVEGGSLYKYLCGAKPFFIPPPKCVARVGQEFHIVDMWGKDIVYLNCHFYTAARKAADPNYDSKTDPACHNPDTFDLYSTGPDMKKDPGNNHIDDITNFPGW